MKLLKRDSDTGVFSCGFCEILKNTIFYKTPPVAAPVFKVVGKYLKLNTLFQKSLRCNAASLPVITSQTSSSPPEMFLGKSVLKICSKFTGYPCRSVILIKLLCNFIEVTLWHGCPPVNLLYIFRTPFYKNTYKGLLMHRCF